MDLPVLEALYACAVLILIAILVIYFTSHPPNMTMYESEKFFWKTSEMKEKEAFPLLSDPPEIELSVVVPAYNEEERLPVMLDEAMDYLTHRQKTMPNFSYEVIIVDDGSRDKTSQIGLKYSDKYGAEHIRVMTLAKNRGKGGAIRMGMLSARGKILLFADADGATKFCDLQSLEIAMTKLNTADNTNVIVCGSRASLKQESIAQRSVFRTILMFGFHFLVWFFCIRDIEDTQCGFKLMTRSAARIVFSNLHVEGWAFDVDMLYIAETLNFKLAEVAVTWKEIDGSKITPFWSWLEMGRDLLLIWFRYFIRAWTIKVEKDKDR